MDKVVDEVGEENIMQVITDNEASSKAVGHFLIKKAFILVSLYSTLHLFNA